MARSIRPSISRFLLRLMCTIQARRMVGQVRLNKNEPVGLKEGSVAYHERYDE